MEQIAEDVKKRFISDTEEIFGHSIPMNKLIELIETSPLKKHSQKEMTQKRNKLSRQISTLKKEYQDLEVYDIVLDECDSCGETLSVENKDGVWEDTNQQCIEEDGEGNEVWECMMCGHRWKVSPEAYPSKK